MAMLGRFSMPTPPLLASGSHAWNALSSAQRHAVDHYVAHALGSGTPRIDLGHYVENVKPAASPRTAIHVLFNEHAEASFDIALVTVGLSTCSALAILDPRQQSHYLAHVMALSCAPDLINALHHFYPEKHDELEIYVLPGEPADMPGAADRSLANIFSALVFAGLADRTRLLRYTGKDKYPSVLLYGGKLYNFDQSIPMDMDNARPLTTAYGLLYR